VPCPKGSYRANTKGKDADSCGPCPAGTYCPNPGTSAPTPCKAGHFCPEGAGAAQACPRGTFYGSTGLYDSRGCTACTAGYYCPQMGQTAVDTTNHLCDAGFYCSGGASRPEPTDATTGSRCPAGRYCGQGVSAPSNCPAGEYGPFIGAVKEDDCVLCRPGYYCLGSSSADATSQCPAGYVCTGGVIDYTSHASASLAPIGSYAEIGSQVAQPCQAGRYNGAE